MSRSGQIVDASIIKAPIRQTCKKNNELIKKGKKSMDCDKLSKFKKSQTDIDARWTKKGRKSYFGYKSHTNVDKEYGLTLQRKLLETFVD